MPELPEVETTKQGLLPHIMSSPVSKVNIRYPNLRWPIPDEVRSIESFTALSLERRAKYLIWTFQTGSLIMHLGMSGAMRVVDAHEAYLKHDHFEVVFESGKALRLNDPRRFGAILWQEPNEQLALLKNLGPEPLTNDFNGQYLFECLTKRKGAIKNAIMNNAVVVGVGNIYASESLFLSQIHPSQAANQLTLEQCNNLCATIKNVLKQAITQGGTTLKDFTQTDGSPGYFAQKLNVYGRKGEACLHCSNPIESVTIGQRASFYCPNCQPLK